MHFGEGTRKLGETVGEGDLTGKVEIPVPYAAPQHEGMWHTGPLAGVVIRNQRGGGRYFLSHPLSERGPEWLLAVARDAVKGRQPRHEMADAMEELTQEVAKRAPVRSGQLRRSAAHPVTDNGRKVYERRGFWSQEHDLS